MRFCSSCGTPLREGVRFCESCGAALAPPAATPPAVHEPAAATEHVPAPVAVLDPPADVGAPVAPAAPRRSRRGLLTGIGAVAAVGVLGTVGWFVYDRIAGPNGGADTPQAAVEQLAAAAEAEDAVTALSLLPPDEVGPLVELYQDVEAKATSTKVAAADDPLAGFDLTVDGVTVTTEDLGDDVAAVTVTGGTVSWTVDPTKMQGPLRLDPSGGDRGATEGSADLVEVTQRATDGAPLRIMTVQRDGAWYVSPMYTLLETWRTSQGLPAPDFTAELALDGTGADSPEAVVQDAAQAVATYDVDGLLDLLSPEEAAAAYQYREAITAALYRDGALAELQSEGGFSYDSLDVVAGDEVDGRVPVTVRSAAGGVTDGDGDYTAWRLDGNCLNWTEPDGDSDGGCLPDLLAEEGLGGDLASGFDSLTLLTQEVDGRWYLSPVATAVADLRTVVSGMDADTVASTLGAPQFGGVDGTLEDGTPVTGEVQGWQGPALYEVAVPAGQVLSTCAEGDVFPYLYAPDGRPLERDAVLATDAGTYRVLVGGQGEGNAASPFTIRAALSSVEEITVPVTVPPVQGGGCGSRLLAFEPTVGEPLLFSTGDESSVQVTTPSGESVWGTAFVPQESGIHYLSVAADAEVEIGTLTEEVLTVGDSVTVDTSGMAPPTVRVFVPAGQDVRIDVTSGYPYAELSTLDGSLVASGDGGFTGTSSLYPPSYESAIYELAVEDLGTTDTVRVTVAAG
jgi:hypothetical protein